MKHTLFTLALVLLALLSASCGDKKKVVYPLAELKRA